MEVANPPKSSFLEQTRWHDIEQMLLALRMGRSGGHRAESMEDTFGISGRGRV